MAVLFDRRVATDVDVEGDEPEAALDATGAVNVCAGDELAGRTTPTVATDGCPRAALSKSPTAVLSSPIT